MEENSMGEAARKVRKKGGWYGGERGREDRMGRRGDTVVGGGDAGRD